MNNANTTSFIPTTNTILATVCMVQAYEMVDAADLATSRQDMLEFLGMACEYAFEALFSRSSAGIDGGTTERLLSIANSYYSEMGYSPVALVSIPG